MFRVKPKLVLTNIFLYNEFNIFLYIKNSNKGIEFIIKKTNYL